jgi:hypothetical protein
MEGRLRLGTPPRIFVSHSHEDATWCEAFVASLRRYDADVWYDVDSMRLGSFSS